MRAAVLVLASTFIGSALAGCLQGPVAPVAPAQVLAGAMAAKMTLPVVVDAKGGAGEPSLFVDKDGAIYISAPKGSARYRADELWTSTDGGKTFTDLGSPDYPFGGGDSDVTMDEAGTLYVAGQWGARAYVGDTPLAAVTGPALGYPNPVCESVAVSHDKGKSWAINPIACVQAGGVDRQWLDTKGAGTVYLAFNTFGPAVLGFGLQVVKSTDSGQTWTPMRVPTEGVTANEFSSRGNLAVDKKSGYAYVGHASAKGPAVWVSDGSSDFTLKQVFETKNDVSSIFNVVAVGKDGTVYEAWSEDLKENGHAIFIAHSTDKGDHWSKPQKVDAGKSTAIFPWIAAGDAGRAAVAWYASSEIANPNKASANATWDAFLATSTNALDANATWAQTKITEKPLHQGVLCTNGSGCDSQYRRLLDFFEIAIGPDGRVHVIMTDDTAGKDKPVVNLYAAQEGGALMLDVASK